MASDKFVLFGLTVDASQFMEMAKRYSDTLHALARYGAEMIESAGIDHGPAYRAGIVDRDGNLPRDLWEMIGQLRGSAKGSAIYDHRCGPGCACASSGGHAPCAGPNCGCTDGKSHSAECVTAHEAAYTGVKA